MKKKKKNRKYENRDCWRILYGSELISLEST